MFKISGLQEMQDQLAQAQQALKAIDGEVGTVNFDPHDPVSVECAIRSMEVMIDGKLATSHRWSNGRPSMPAWLTPWFDLTRPCANGSRN
jgi:hypothetical protein